MLTSRTSKRDTWESTLAHDNDWGFSSDFGCGGRRIHICLRCLIQIYVAATICLGWDSGQSLAAGVGRLGPFLSVIVRFACIYMIELIVSEVTILGYRCTKRDRRMTIGDGRPWNKHFLEYIAALPGFEL